MTTISGIAEQPQVRRMTAAPARVQVSQTIGSYTPSFDEIAPLLSKHSLRVSEWRRLPLLTPPKTES